MAIEIAVYFLVSKEFKSIQLCRLDAPVNALPDLNQWAHTTLNLHHKSYSHFLHIASDMYTAIYQLREADHSINCGKDGTHGLPTRLDHKRLVSGSWVSNGRTKIRRRESCMIWAHMQIVYNTELGIQSLQKCAITDSHMVTIYL
jgi:hypothetical protein